MSLPRLPIMGILSEIPAMVIEAPDPMAQIFCDLGVLCDSTSDWQSTVVGGRASLNPKRYG